MRSSIKNVIIAALTCGVAVAAAPCVVHRPGPLDNHSPSPLMLRAATVTGAVARGLHKTSQQMEWVETSSANFLYSAAANAWSLDFRDTSIYDSRGRLAVVRTSLAHAGWNIDSMYEIDSTVWSGSQPMEYDSLYFYLGELDGAGCVRYTLGYLADRKTFIKTKYVYGADSWIISGVDSLSCASPITDPSFYYYNDSSKFMSLRSYAASAPGGALRLVSSTTRIDAESNSTRLALLSLSANAGVMDSSKIYETLSADGAIITSDSIIVKSASGAWVANSRAGNSYGAGGDWRYRQQMLRQGVWTTSDSLVVFADGGGYEIYRPAPDSFFAYFWDQWGGDTLEVTAIKSDTSYGHWIYTRDADDNIVRQVGYTSDKAGSNKLKTDSSSFTYAQIRVNPVRFNRSPHCAAAVSFGRTPAALRISAPGITGLRLYDMTGRMIASVNQPSAPTLVFAWRGRQARPAREFYAARVITENGIITRTVSCDR